MTLYNFAALNIEGDVISFDQFKGKVVIVVNTASECYFTYQYKELEQLYQKYKDQGLVILGFPCNQFANQDKGSNEEIHEFCQLNYGVTFTMFEKIEVNGENAHPLYKFLRKEAKGLFGNKIKWNFTKFLIDSQGNIIKRYAPTVKPQQIKTDIEKLLK